jgi:hypothetical protein
MRSPAGIGFWVDIISFTFDTAVGVRFTGVVLGGAVVSTGTLVVAIFNSLLQET